MYSIGIYMDQIDGVDFKKDSTVSIMRHLQNKAEDVNLYFDVVIDEAGFELSRELASAEVQPGGAIYQIGLGSAKGG